MSIAPRYSNRSVTAGKRDVLWVNIERHGRGVLQSVESGGVETGRTLAVVTELR